MSMTVHDARQSFASLGSGTRAAPPPGEPMIRPQGIRWRGGVHGRPLVLELTLENPHAETTRPTRAVLRRAEFGAFQRWTPIRTLRIPPIAAGGRTVLTLDRLPTEDRRRWLLDFRARRLRSLSSLAGKVPLQKAVHFVGNFDLIVGSQRPVERHFGHLDDLRPGCLNVTLFKVGDGKQDNYTFRVVDCEAGWAVKLACQGQHDLTEGTTLPIAHEVIQVGVTPPAGAEHGTVVVGVRREGTDESCVVEFTLDVAR